jgi:L-ascorbate metabolism protein UlaG (beta-lactamase superfamily)
MQPVIRGTRFYNDESDRLESVLLGTGISLAKAVFNRSSRSYQGDRSAWQYQGNMAPSVEIPEVVWCGHATFAIRTPMETIMVDPIFHDPSCLFKRMLPHVIPLEQLISQTTTILISHNHPDHLDIPTLKRFVPFQPHIYVPWGDGALVRSIGFEHVREFAWWESAHETTHDTDATCTFVPARHWSGRGLFDRNKSLWGGWLIKHGNYTIFHAGDTAYGDHFKAIAAHASRIDCALLPIAPCTPQPWMHRTHMDSAQAGQAFCDLGAQLFIPSHWGTFAFGDDTFDGPLIRLASWWQEHLPNSPKQVIIPQIGQPISLALRAEISNSDVFQRVFKNQQSPRL